VIHDVIVIENPMFTPSNREKVEDQRGDSDIEQANLMNSLFVRPGAKDTRFTKVDFRYSIFDTCYLRACTFDSCDFTGCRFLATSLYGSHFIGCKFDYAVFERTNVDSDLLSSSCPGHENLKMRFARTSRMNFQQLGDAQAANKAIEVELQATLETGEKIAAKQTRMDMRKKQNGKSEWKYNNP
jgi:uncharacterized protein YjbI with pentapeptide repeats